jgi:hypothetical protein
MSIKFTIPNVPTAVDYTATSVSNNGATIPVINKPTLATVATSGAYTDLVSKPTFATVATSGAYTDLTGKPVLAAVATSGKYDDLTGNIGAASAFPVTGMTSNTSSDGFVASVSTQANAQLPAYNAFDKNSVTNWSSNPVYTSGGYTGGLSTPISTGGGIPGEWLQLQTPVPYRLVNYTLTDRQQREKQWNLVGSLDGTIWTVIDSQNLTAVQTAVSVTYTPSSTAGPYSYYRFIINATFGGNPYTDLADLSFFGVPVPSYGSFPVNALTSNSSPDGFVASASSAGASNQAYAAFDKSLATSFASASAYTSSTGAYPGTTSTTVSGTAVAGEWVQLQTPVPYRLTSYRMTDANGREKQWTLAGSTDGSTWTLLDQNTLATAQTAATTYVPYYATAVPYSYFRFIVQAVTSGNVTSDLVELLFFGVPAISSTPIAFGGNGYLAGNLTAGELTKTNALAATWYQGATGASLAAGAATYPGPWVLQSFSKVPSGLTLLNGSNNLVIPYNGVYFMSWTARFNTYSSEIAISFNPSSGTYGSGTRRLGAADFQSGALNPISSYVGYFTAGDVIAPTVYTATTNTVGANNGDTYLSLVLIARTP